MSLFYGYDVTGKLSTTGGDMTGDINMGSHHIITSVDPMANAHLERKKYVDDKVASSRGGTSAGNFVKNRRHNDGKYKHGQ